MKLYLIFLNAIIFFKLSSLSAQEIDLQNHKLNIKIEADSVLIYRERNLFKALIHVTCNEKIRLNKVLYDSNHFFGDGICYELEVFNGNDFVAYDKIEGGFGMDVNYSNLEDYHTFYAKEFLFECHPFFIHEPLCNFIYRLRVMVIENEKMLCHSSWHYLLLVKRKKELGDLKNLLKTYKMKIINEE